MDLFTWSNVDPLTRVTLLYKVLSLGLSHWLNLAPRETTARSLSLKQPNWFFDSRFAFASFFSIKFIFLAVHILMFLSRFQNNVRAKIFGKIRRHAWVYFWTHCGQIGLEVHAVKLTLGFEFFNVLLEYLHRSWRPWPLLGKRTLRIQTRRTLFFDLSRGKSSSTSFRVVRRSFVLSSTTGSSSSRSFRDMSTLLSPDCSELCSNDLASTERRKYFPGFRGNLTVIRSHKSWPSRRVTLPQVFTWENVGPPGRVALPRI